MRRFCRAEMALYFCLAYLALAIISATPIKTASSSSEWLEASQLRSKLISEENQLPGSLDWWRPYLSRFTPGAEENNRNLESPAMSLEGFSTSISINPGQTISFKVDYTFLASEGNLSVAYKFVLKIYRLGYYGGRGAREITVLPISILSAAHYHASYTYLSEDADRVRHSQAACASSDAPDGDRKSQTVDCSNWEVSAKWDVPSSALSGVYMAVPVAATRGLGKSTPINPNGPISIIGQYIPFVVTSPPNQGSALLVKTSDLTWVAYNNYGGWNFYHGPQNGTAAGSRRDLSHDFTGRSKIASYDRPWHNRLTFPRGQAHNFVLHTEYPLIYWLEQHSYDVSYAACRDFEQRFGGAGGAGVAAALHKVFVSSGHDEYWTAGLRSVWSSARDAGLNLAFLSGNELFWRVAWQTDSATRDANDSHTAKENHRKVLCRKETLESLPLATLTGVAADWTGTFLDARQPGFDRSSAATPQNALTGQLYLVNAYRNDPLEVPVEFSQLRFWRHTRDVSRLHHSEQKSNAGYRSSAGLLGYEWDVQSFDRFRPPGLIPLSRTRADIKGQLMQNYGASYGGSGSVRHSLTLYRQQQSGALVFSTGTCQWAWALAPLHDYSWDIAHVPLDVNMQQATMNVFADMYALPWRSADVAVKEKESDRDLQPWATYFISTNASAPLVAVYPSEDTVPPRSNILWPEAGAAPRIQPKQRSSGTGEGGRALSTRSLSERVSVRIRGTAADVGGVVALVEVSCDGGRTWGVAHGRENWIFPILFRFPKTAQIGVDTFAHDSERAAKQIFPDYPSTDVNIRSTDRNNTHAMHVTYQDGGPRYSIDVCNPAGHNLENWTEYVTLQSRATDDSGWSEGGARAGVVGGQSPHVVQVLCRKALHT